jgi:peptide/nickel transport system permease protein
LIVLIVRRLLLLVPLLIGVSLISFIVTHLLPGDPARLYAGIQANEATVQGIRAEYGFDQPLPVQYERYFIGLLHGDLGKSVRTRNPVAGDLAARVPATLELAVAAITIAFVVAIPLGILSAAWRGGILDRFGRGLAVFGVAVPDFWLGLILIFVLYYLLKLAPAPVGRLGMVTTPPKGPTGFFLIDALVARNPATFGDTLSHLALPAITLAIPAMAPLLRLTRNAAIDVLRSDYVLFARASGLKGVRLYMRYVLRNALPGSVTMAGLLVGYMVGGAVLVEKVFAWPGVGLYMANSLDFNDYAAIQGVVLFSASVYLVVFLVLDLVQFALDPRLKAT